jgi:hypothetical protein
VTYLTGTQRLRRYFEDEMALRILCAGGTAEERERAEALTRAAIGPVQPAEAWQVSLVRTAGQWSVTLDGPGENLRGKHAAATEEKLREAILGLLPAPPPSEAHREVEVAASPETRRDPHRCAACGRTFLITYEAVPEEPSEIVPVACPHCWQIDRAEVAESAALEGSYTAERLEA